MQFARYVLLHGKYSGNARLVHVWHRVCRYLAPGFHLRDAPLQVLCIAQPGYYCLAITASTVNY